MGRSVSIRDLRRHAGEVVDRATRGEDITVMPAGRTVATLRPIPKAPLPAEALIARWHGLPSATPK